jgi:tRNA-Thr(GGU) m(6)t(6)A37 methyltransferase TsaA
MELKPIGVIRTPFKQAAGTPIQPAFAEGAKGRIELFEEYAEGLRDLDGFERIWLLYWFDRTGPPCMTVTPFMDERPRGLFATRAPCRPNPIGLSPVRLLAVAENVLHVADVDVLDGTPLLDIKPYAPRFDHFHVGRSGWLERASGRTAADARFEQQEDAEQ